MRKKHMKNILLSFLLAFLLAFPANAKNASEQLAETNAQKNQTESNLKSVNDRLAKLENSKSSITSYMQELNVQLTDINTSLDELETLEKEKEEEIKSVKKELSAAKKTEKKQYNSMKKRIKYIYENGNLNFFSVLFGAEDMSDMLNKLDFITEISKYDRNMLEEYQKAKEAVTLTEQTLRQEQLALADLEKQTKEQQDGVYALLSKASGELSGFNSEISSAQKQISDYEQQLKLQEEKILQAKQEEQAPPAEDPPSKPNDNAPSKPAAPNGSGNGSAPSGSQGGEDGKTDPSPSTPNDSSDLELLAAIIECEAGGEIMEGKIAVGNVVLNRVKSGSYPNTVFGVIYQKSQFTPVASGRFALVLARGANSSCKTAANRAMAGENYVGNLLHFRQAKSTDEGLIIGNHYFY